MALAFEDKQGADRKRKGTKYFVAPYKGLQDSLGFWIPWRRFWILCQWNLRLQISIFRGISHSLRCIFNSKAQDSGIHNQNFLDYRFQKQKFP